MFSLQKPLNQRPFHQAAFFAFAHSVAYCSRVSSMCIWCRLSFSFTYAPFRGLWPRKLPPAGGIGVRGFRPCERRKCTFARCLHGLSPSPEGLFFSCVAPKFFLREFFRHADRFCEFGSVDKIPRLIPPRSEGSGLTGDYGEKASKIPDGTRSLRASHPEHPTDADP